MDDFKVSFEVQIVGKMLTKDARLPVKGGKVTFHVLSTDYKNNVTTAADGSFKLHILDPDAKSPSSLYTLPMNVPHFSWHTVAPIHAKKCIVGRIILILVQGFCE